MTSIAPLWKYKVPQPMVVSTEIEAVNSRDIFVVSH